MTLLLGGVPVGNPAKVHTGVLWPGRVELVLEFPGRRKKTVCVIGGRVITPAALLYLVICSSIADWAFSLPELMTS